MTHRTCSGDTRYRLRPDSPSDGLLLVGALAIGTLWRLPPVSQAFLFGDELHTLVDVPLGFEHILSHFSATGSGLGLPLLQRLLIDVFGANHWAIRAPAWLPGLALLPTVWLITRRWLGDRVALGATWLVAVSPLLVFYSHFARAYALVAWLVLILVDRIQATLEAGRIDGRRIAVIAVLSGLIPWLHPTALASVVPIGLAGAGAALLDSTHDLTIRRRVSLGLFVALAAGGLLCIGLHGPALASLEKFIAAKTSQQYLGEFGPLDVSALIVGGRMAAVGFAIVAAGGALALYRVCGIRLLPLLAAGTAPPLIVAALRPYGDAYAYARYVIAAIPLLLIGVAYGIDRIAQSLIPRLRAHSPWLTAALSLGLLAQGPPGPFRDPAPQYANTYLGLHPLPAFDAPWPATPRFYRDLRARSAAEGSTSTLIESPALTTRTRQLYRHYQLQHGYRTLLAPLTGEFPLLPAGPYVALFEPGGIERSGADYLVLHRNVAEELSRYWDFVFDTYDSAPNKGDAAYMARHRNYGGLLPPAPPRLVASLEWRFGEPIYEDEMIWVWRIAAKRSADRGHEGD